MKLIKLQNSSSSVMVDNEDFERISAYKWYINDNKSSISRQKKIDGKQTRFSLASEIMRQHKQMFDHIDRDLLNNQKENLRPCTNMQNAMNRIKLRGCSSQHKGVCFDKSNGKWRAMIRVDYTLKNLGSFASEKDAAIAYNNAAIAHFKEFAILNEI